MDYLATLFLLHMLHRIQERSWDFISSLEGEWQNALRSHSFVYRSIDLCYGRSRRWRQTTFSANFPALFAEIYKCEVPLLQSAPPPRLDLHHHHHPVMGWELTDNLFRSKLCLCTTDQLGTCHEFPEYRKVSSNARHHTFTSREQWQTWIPVLKAVYDLVTADLARQTLQCHFNTCF